MMVAAFCVLVPDSPGHSQLPLGDSQLPLRYSCSAEIFEAFETERVPAFTEVTGINVELHISSSNAAVTRLTHYFSDIASTTRRLSDFQREEGYVATMFCKEPMAVVVNGQCPVGDISKKQLQDVFARNISNWKEIGGPDEPILLILPDRDTAAYLNFERQVMTQGQIVYDLMTRLSSQVIDAVKRFPWSISFITECGVTNEAGVKKLKIDGLSTEDKDYPYYQEFLFVTKGTPLGHAKAFLDFAFSTKGIEIVKKKGMTPVLP
jgi:ABC-type phosphate transport system substrate-binding protein